MLEQAGFEDVTTYGDLAEQPATEAGQSPGRLPAQIVSGACALWPSAPN